MAMSEPSTIVLADIAGATGYTGQELVRILLAHPRARINALYSTSEDSRLFSEFFPRFASLTQLRVKSLDLGRLAASKASVVFLALPHTVSMGAVPALLKAGKKVIDLSADYRLKDTAIYKKHYGRDHSDAAGLKRAVYGLPELNRHKIKGASLVANPGCYPTASILAVAPCLAMSLIDPDSLIIDAKSGTSGAGKKAMQEMLFTEVHDDFRPYKVNDHQHVPEMEQELSKLGGGRLKLTFVPHLLPLSRGILVTAYARSRNGKKLETGQVRSLYEKFYKNEHFVRIRGENDLPRLKDVNNTNFCDIWVKAFGERIIIISCIDNLVKGASGQAVQNMNILYGFDEFTALT